MIKSRHISVRLFTYDISELKYKHEGVATTLKNLIDSGVLALDEEFLKRK